MKRPVFNPNFDQNWSWPEKTWFRERLNTIKARERETHPKPWDRHHNPTTVEAKSQGDEDPQEE